MKRFALVLALICVFIPVRAQEEFDGQSCTSIMVGRAATTDGSVITSHTCDGRYRTWMQMAPGGVQPPGPAYILRGTLRTGGLFDGITYSYRYLNTAYPCLNEKQLAFGETTFGGPKELMNDKAMFFIEELQRMALQRCDNARDAIRLMGFMAEKYGYADSGECLTVADKNEVWQFEIVGVGKDKIGAAWVAKRIPDGHVGVSANIPRIGRIDRKDPDMMASDNVEQVAVDNGLWDGKGDFVFWRVFNCDYAKGKNYSDRELFILNYFAPSLGLNSDMDEIPFSVEPEHKVDIREVMALFRETYEGTAIDMCQNVKMIHKGDTIVSPIANPWMSTATRNTLNYLAPGTVDFHRTVAVAWCAYSHVTQLRNWLPDGIGGICWVSVDNPAQSPRIPVFCGTTELPEEFNTCGQKKYDPNCALWRFRKANKLGTVQWQRTKGLFNDEVLRLESLAFDGLPALADEYASNPGCLDAYTNYIYTEAVQAWQALEEKLWLTFGMGF